LNYVSTAVRSVRCQ